MKKFSLLFALVILTYTSQSQQKKVACPQLQLSFSVPSTFKSLNNDDLDKLSKKGEQALKEEFNNDKVLGWQKGCINLQDSLKRSIIVNRYSVKEAVKQDGSVKVFIDKTFDESNEFLIRRLESRAGISFNKADVVKQSTITIAGYQVRKSALTMVKDNKLLLMARYYFFEKDGQLYLLGFTAGKATDNQQIEKAIEAATKL